MSEKREPEIPYEQKTKTGHSVGARIGQRKFRMSKNENRKFRISEKRKPEIPYVQ